MGFMIAVSSIEGGIQWLDGGAMFGHVPRTLWSRWTDVDEAGRIPLACRAMLIEYEGKRILCDAGIGAFFNPQMQDRFGLTGQGHVLLDSLADTGLSHEEIDWVVLGHLHFDHAGGLLPAADDSLERSEELLFPNATYVIGRAAWDRCRNPHRRDRASFIPGLAEKLEASGRLYVAEGASIPGCAEDRLSFRYSSGHTPGQGHVLFRGDRETVFFAGDLIPGTAWVNLPVTMGYDRCAEQTVDEKAELYKEAVSGNWLLFYAHDLKTAASRVERNAPGRFEAYDLFPRIKRMEV
jgi:glyoxylase-like metal-dependent hydrolase (beta-lactamase superfamily II)